MKKKFTAMIGMAVLTVAMASVAFAAAPDSNARNNDGPRYGYGAGCCASADRSYGFMMDDNGKWLSKDAFTQKLDKAIKDKQIDAKDREFYARMYEDCVNGNGNGNGRGMMGGGRFS